MDANELAKRERLAERDVWLLLTGAMLASKPIRAEAFASLEAGQCPCRELAAMLDGLKAEDPDRVWSWAAKLGLVKADEKTSVAKAAIANLKRRIAKRECGIAANKVCASAKIEEPEQFAELLEEMAKKIRGTL